MNPIAPWHVYFVTQCRHAKPQPKDKFVVIMCNNIALVDATAAGLREGLDDKPHPPLVIAAKTVRNHRVV